MSALWFDVSVILSVVAAWAIVGIVLGEDY